MSENFASKFKPPTRYGSGEESIWNEFNAIATTLNPVNLGQGCPDFPPPKQITEALALVAKSNDPDLHQYTRGYGHMRLVKILAKLYSKLTGITINPCTDFLITGGAYGALFATIYGYVEQGDEVILIEPFFDCYEPMVRACGGIPRFIPLRYHQGDTSAISSSQFALEKLELENLFNEKTKAIVLNNPNNPLGKVFNLEELTIIADLCKKWNVLCISDEVYEWMVYKPEKHIRIASLPGMWNRTITIGSAGKTFSVTGWKVGWAYGPDHLIKNLRIVHQNTIYTTATPLQEALAKEFERNFELLQTKPEETYFYSLLQELTKKKDFLINAIKEGGMVPIIPQGGYFVMADISVLDNMKNIPEHKNDCPDIQKAKWMAKRVGVLGIPPSAFYSKDHKYLANNFIRFCFIKRDETLKKAANLFKIRNM